MATSQISPPPLLHHNVSSRDTDSNCVGVRLCVCYNGFVHTLACERVCVCACAASQI